MPKLYLLNKFLDKYFYVKVNYLFASIPRYTLDQEHVITIRAFFFSFLLISVELNNKRLKKTSNFVGF